MQVKPAPDRVVPDPEKGGSLPQEGRVVEATAYWLRRLAEGDVVEFEVKPPTKKQERQA